MATTNFVESKSDTQNIHIQSLLCATHQSSIDMLETAMSIGASAEFGVGSSPELEGEGR